MLRWPIAANAPSTIEAMETNTTICCHCGVLRSRGEEGRHRLRRALVDVGRPHMERHGGHLEAETGEQKHKAQGQAEATLPRGLGDAGEVHCAGEAVDQRRA